MVYSFRLVNFGWFPKKKVLQNGSIKGMNHWISYVFQVIETIFYIKKKFIIRWDGPKMSRHIYFKIPKRIAASSSSSARKKFPPREAAAFPVLLLLGSEKNLENSPDRASIFSVGRSAWNGKGNAWPLLAHPKYYILTLSVPSTHTDKWGLIRNKCKDSTQH